MTAAALKNKKKIGIDKTADFVYTIDNFIDKCEEDPMSPGIPPQRAAGWCEAATEPAGSLTSEQDFEKESPGRPVTAEGLIGAC